MKSSDAALSTRARRLTAIALLAWGAAMSMGDVLVFCVPTALALLAEHRAARAPALPTLADRITRARVLATLLLSSGLVQREPSWAVGLGVAILATDGLDGWVARKQGTAGPAGAWLDMEADALLVASTSLAAYIYAGVGAWILLCGLARYLYVAVLWRWPARGPVPRARWAQWSFVLGTLALVCLPLLPASSRFVVGAAACLNTVWSFGRSFAWSYRPGRA